MSQVRKLLVMPGRASERVFEKMLQRACEFQKAKERRLAGKMTAISGRRAS
jgi:hypothetical protein